MTIHGKNRMKAVPGVFVKKLWDRANLNSGPHREG
jgi:hypothetical protein